MYVCLYVWIETTQHKIFTNQQALDQLTVDYLRETEKASVCNINNNAMFSDTSYNLLYEDNLCLRTGK